MTPAEKIALDTWERLKQSQQFKVKLGEGTLTDLLALDFVRLMGKRTARLFQTSTEQESRRGCDLEIRINQGGGKSIVFAVQAKKLYLPQGRYNSLNHKVESSNSFQIDVLETYSEEMAAIPFYILYNLFMLYI